MSSDPDCIFCKIVRGDIPSFRIFEDELTIAFMDINPANVGHALVIPRRHAEDLYGIDDESLTAVARAAQRVARAVERTVDSQGLNLVQCNGDAAGQSVYHFHMHVLPRAIGDDLKLNWGIRPGDMKSIGELAERIKANVET